MSKWTARVQLLLNAPQLPTPPASRWNIPASGQPDIPRHYPQLQGPQRGDHLGSRIKYNANIRQRLTTISPRTRTQVLLPNNDAYQDPDINRHQSSRTPSMRSLVRACGKSFLS